MLLARFASAAAAAVPTAPWCLRQHGPRNRSGHAAWRLAHRRTRCDGQLRLLPSAGQPGGEPAEGSSVSLSLCLSSQKERRNLDSVPTIVNHELWRWTHEHSIFGLTSKRLREGRMCVRALAPPETAGARCSPGPATALRTGFWQWSLPGLQPGSLEGRGSALVEPPAGRQHRPPSVRCVLF